MGAALGRKQILSVLVAVACFGALSVGGAVWGATSTLTSAATPTTGGLVHVFDDSNGDGAGSTAVLTGAIGDVGEAVSVYPDGRIDPQPNAELTFALTRGSFRIDVTGLAHKITVALDHARLNPVTCSGDVRVTGPTPVVAGSGTGLYRGITGRFELTVTVAEIASPSTCTLSEPLLGHADEPLLGQAGVPLLGQADFITGPGTVSFGEPSRPVKPFVR